MPPSKAVPLSSIFAVVAGLVLALPAPGAQPPANRDQCDYGITLAMSGSLARAESVFVSLLAPGRGDARALNNLGNLQLLQGEAEVALAFYERAIQSDTADAGIRLNRSVALLILGREEESRLEADAGIRQAGGLSAAAALLGLHADSSAAPPKGAEAARVSREEVKALLSAAARGVPRDSTARSATATKPARRPASAWRSGGPRAAQDSDALAVLYWKR